MAARINLRQDEETRRKIQTSQLINRLQANALGDLVPELSNSRLKSIEILLRKTVPDLQAITIGGDEQNPLAVILTGLGAAVDNKLARLVAGSTPVAPKPTD